MEEETRDRMVIGGQNGDRHIQGFEYQRISEAPENNDDVLKCVLQK